jgi:hypothetical protein
VFYEVLATNNNGMIYWHIKEEERCSIDVRTGRDIMVSDENGTDTHTAHLPCPKGLLNFFPHKPLDPLDVDDDDFVSSSVPALFAALVATSLNTAPLNSAASRPSQPQRMGDANRTGFIYDGNSLPVMMNMDMYGYTAQTFRHG